MDNYMSFIQEVSCHCTIKPAFLKDMYRINSTTGLYNYFPLAFLYTLIHSRFIINKLLKGHQLHLVVMKPEKCSCTYILFSSSSTFSDCVRKKKMLFQAWLDTAILRFMILLPSAVNMHFYEEITKCFLFGAWSSQMPRNRHLQICLKMFLKVYIVCIFLWSFHWWF